MSGLAMSFLGGTLEMQFSRFSSSPSIAFRV